MGSPIIAINTKSHFEFVVVMRAAAGFHFEEPDAALIVKSFPTPVGPADILFASRFAARPGFQKAIRQGIRVEARGKADSVNQAAAAFGNAARALSAVLSFCANSSCRDLEFELVYDATAGKTEREFFQQFLPEERLTPHYGRPVPIPAILDVIKAIGGHPKSERLHRAVAHYHHALQNWEPGSEMLALAHLYMGMETLTPVAIRQHLIREAITREDLAKQWGIDWEDNQQRKGFDSQVRRRLLFAGDDATFTAAKNTSDGYEHGFMSLPDVHAQATDARDLTAEYLRCAVLDLAEVSQTTRDVLLSSPYEEPMYWSFTKYARGAILGGRDELAAPDQMYPILRLVTTPREIENPHAAFPILFEEKITPRLAEDMTFRLDRFEVWGPPASPLKAQKTSSS